MMHLLCHARWFQRVRLSSDFVLYALLFVKISNVILVFQMSQSMAQLGCLL